MERDVSVHLVKLNGVLPLWLICFLEALVFDGCPSWCGRLEFLRNGPFQKGVE